MILGGLLSSVSHGISRRRVDASAEEATPTDTGPMPPVEIPFNEHPTLFRPSITVLADIWDERRMQVVFQDVTEERRQRELVETFAAHVILGQEEERQRISQELHDGPLQNLIHLCRQIDAVDQSNGAMSSTDELRKSTEDLVQEIRSISRGLRPSALDDLGLVASIGQLLTDAERRHHIATSFGVTGQERRLPSDVELALFRIAQEALSNIERHAAARTVAVGLDFEGGGLRLLVKDDGIGFAPDTTRRASANQSLGIPGMAERASLIGARLCRSLPTRLWHFDRRPRPGCGYRPNNWASDRTFRCPSGNSPHISAVTCRPIQPSFARNCHSTDMKSRLEPHQFVGY